MARVDERPSPQPPSDPPPRPVRARSVAELFAVVPTAIWIGMGLLIVLVGFAALRPRAAAPPDDEALARWQATPRVQPLSGATATPAPRIALEPITPVAVAQAPAPRTDTGAVIGNPELASVVTEERDATAAYTVQAGDTLISVATRYQVSLDHLMEINGITNPDALYVGQVLLLPSSVQLAAPFQRLLPDSEVVLGPAYRDYDLGAVVQQHGGLLASYSELAEGESLSGVEIVDRVSKRYSVGPRVLLAVLEYRSGWLTTPDPPERAYPLGVREPVRAGLFYQLSWAANRLNEGYYGQYTGRDREINFQDGTRALYHDETNPGTSAIQNLFAVYHSPDTWAHDLAEDGFFATYVSLFGDPWAHAVEPLIPDGLTQPELTFPWRDTETWYFTGGPHGGWGDFSGWAALDFVPNDRTGCYPSDYWVTAAAPGLVVRSENGEVVVDLDGDGFVGTGWTLFYMHMASAGRVGEGTRVEVGDPIGRPSCEGGFSDAAHLHFARRYNGQWIEADGPIPLVMAGWQAVRTNKSYDGFLVRGEEEREACACRIEGLNDLRLAPLPATTGEPVGE